MKSSFNLTAAALGLVALSAQAAPLSAGNLVVDRIGNGSAALSSAAAPVFLDESTASGSFVQSLALPTATGAGVNALTDSGSATSDGYISRSVDGRSVVVPGYIAAPGTAGVANTSSSTVPRNVATVSSSGTVQTTSLGSSALSGNNVRSAATVDGVGVYVGGANGIAYVNTSTSVANLVTTASLNARNLTISGNQLYFSTGSTTAAGTGTGTSTTAGTAATGIYVLGGGLPTSAGSLSSTLIANTASPYAFLFADLDSGVAGVDTLYVADDTSTTGGIRKFSKSAAGAWSLNNTVILSGARGLTGVVNAGQVQLYATTGTNLYGLTDTAGYNANLNGGLTTLATAGANTVFRGVSLTPAVPEPATYGLALVGLVLMGASARSRFNRLLK
jgi:hypothetical protein